MEDQMWQGGDSPQRASFESRWPWRSLLIVLLVGFGGTTGGSCKKSQKANSATRIAGFLKCVDVARSEPPDQRSALLASCVSQEKLFGKTKCNNAWKATHAAAPDEKWRLIAAGCGRLYCPLLKDPKPRLCGRLTQLSQKSVRPLEWHEFHRAVLRKEAGNTISEADLKKVLRALAGALVFQVQEGR
jgi:hypothetical protein